MGRPSMSVKDPAAIMMKSMSTQTPRPPIVKIIASAVPVFPT